jgi:hypothetical protein
MRQAHLLRAHSRGGATARRIASLTFITAALAAAPAAATMAPAWSQSTHPAQAAPPGSTDPSGSGSGHVALSVIRVSAPSDPPVIRG